MKVCDLASVRAASVRARFAVKTSAFYHGDTENTEVLTAGLPGPRGFNAEAQRIIGRHFQTHETGATSRFASLDEMGLL